MKLFLVYMWAVSKERFMEDHEVLLVCAENVEQAKKTSFEKTKLENQVHIDFILEVNNVDGYDIILKKWKQENINKVSDYEEKNY